MDLGARTKQQDANFSEANARPVDEDLHKRLERFVGRTKEMRELLSYAEDARAGHGRLVLISGEPGIGKTRLATEFAKQVEAQGMRVLWGRCWEGEGAPPFWPWVQILRAHLSRATPARPDRQRLIQDIARLVPELRDFQPSGTETPPHTELDVPEMRFRVFDSVARLLLQDIQDVPLVIFLDDLHCADEPTLRLLDFIAATPAASGLIIIATSRPRPPLPSGRPDSTVTALARYAHSVQMSLSGLSTEDIAHLLAIESDPTTADHRVEHLHRQTAGNPFFLLEILRYHFRTHGDAYSPDNTDTPTTLRAAIDVRLDSLSPTSRTLLRVAAVAGHSFSLPTIRIVARSLSVPATAIHTLIEEATQAALITFTDRHCTFRHTILRDVLYDSLPPLDRVTIHKHILTALQILHPVDTDDSIEALAYHSVQASSHFPELLESALAYCLRAASCASSLLAHEDAVTHLRTFLKILPPGSQNTKARFDALLDLGAAQDRSGLWADARISFRAAATLARDNDWPESFASAAIGFAGHWGSTAPPDSPAIELLREAYSLLQTTDSPTLVYILSKLAIVLHTASPQERDVLSEQALSQARKAPTPDIWATALDARAHALSDPTHIDEVLLHATKLLALSQTTKLSSYQVRAHLYRYMVYLHTGDHRAEVEYRVAHRLAEELGHPTFLWKLESITTARAIANGDLSQAVRLAQNTLDLGNRVHDLSAAQISALHTYFLARMRLDFTDLDLRFSWLFERPSSLPFLDAGLALIYCFSDHLQEANRLVDEKLLHTASAVPLNTYYLFTLALLSEVAYYLDRTDLAKLLYPRLLPFAHLNVVVSWGAAFDGPVAHFLGLLATTLTLRSQAYSHFESALKSSRSPGLKGILARTLSAYSEALLRSGDDRLRHNGRTLQAEHVNLHRSLGLHQRLNYHLARLSSPAAPTVPAPTAPIIATRNASSHPSTVCEIAPQYSLMRRGDIWVVRYRADAFHLRSSKSVHQLAHLLQQPGLSIPSVTLATFGWPQGSRPTRASSFSPADAAHDAQTRTPRLDKRALTNYRQRVDEIREDLQRAQSTNDRGLADALTHELEWIMSTLSCDLGLNGRPREMSSEAERARISVRNNLTSIIRRIGLFDSELRSHLARSITTGRLCAYSPTPITQWTVLT